MTASNSGIYGNFGQANYSAAKMGLIGLANTVALEGQKDNIHCNVIIPTAASRLTEDILPPEMFAELKPELIAPVVGYLCHETCGENGIYIDSAAGWAAKCEIIRAKGTLLRNSRNDIVTIENVRDSWNKVTDMNGALKIGSITEATGMLMSALEELDEGHGNSVGKSEKGNPNCDEVFSYTSKDAILYALGVGTSLRIPDHLKFLYESHEDFSVLPTFYILPALQSIFTSDLVANAVPGQSVNLGQTLHGEQYIEFFGDLPTEGSLSSKISILEVLDKGSGAAVVVNVDSYTNSGELVIRNQAVIFFVGAGGFGGPRTGTKAIPCEKRPNRDPDYSVSEKTGIDQAALYRLSGDLNPLHIDPNMAIASGFTTPILHGLATLGYSVRMILSAYANNDCKLFKAAKARFVKPVIPGQTLKVDMWRENNRIYFETSVLETNTVVIGGAYIDLKSANMQPLINRLSSKLQSDAVFEYIMDQVNRDPERAIRIGGVFLYNITKDGKQIKQWTMDLKNAYVHEGAPKDEKPNTTLTISDEDFLLMSQGKLSPQVAFMKGKLKITGNLMMAQKLAPLLKTTSAKL
ncbi:hypothetical protein WA026_021733 [Henosepilachna vigintioctopunctata]|uniref:Peroxisomal multifunctional enzyme type 2 n=1 Tax=Henosepilachna vigintioctopunctata TaxID=420089 RepID=A0AAW1TZD2_9CUCU